MRIGIDTPSIDFIVPRYGPSVVGGAETLCRLLAENLAGAGVRVRVLTTCALDHFSWQNVLPEGASRENGVDVLRFAVGERDSGVWAGLHAQLDLGLPTTFAEQIRWMANSVWSPGLLRAQTEIGAADWTVAMPYLFGTSFWAVAARPERTALIPCMHDEAHARSDIVKSSLLAAGGLIFNTATERDLARDIIGAGHAPAAGPINTCPVVGVGYDPCEVPSTASIDRFTNERAIDAGYLLYAGRREEAKGLPHLFDVYAAYVKATPHPRFLALMGSGDLPVPAEIAPFVIDLGFVPSEDLAAAYAGALALVHPSRMESLGMVLLESWRAGTPALVTGDGPVLVEHCRASGGGMWWTSAPEFTEAVNLLSNDPKLRSTLADAGRHYVNETFGWPAVRARFINALETWS